MGRILLSLAFFLAYSVSVAQDIIPLDESDVDIKVLTWHYNRYENAPPGEWEVVAKDGEGYFRIKFKFQGDELTSIYDDQGFILGESKYYDLEKVPQPVIDLLDYRIVKYKIDSFYQETSFETRNPTKINYRVEARTKTGGVIIYWFDEDFNILPERKDELAFIR